jgi:putative ABC transport system permease protein
LQEPFTLAISRTVAGQLFGVENPIGKVVRVNDSDDFTVVAVFEDLPLQTHLHFDVVGSIRSIDRWFSNRAMDETWDSPNYLTYIRVNSAESVPALRETLSNFLSGVEGVNVPSRAHILLQNVRDIHLNSHALMEVEPQGNKSTVRLFAAIAFFIVLIASINFTNLAVAASKRRDREVGIRKAAGAARRQLILQFIGESTVVTAISLILALVMVEAVLPAFGAFVGTDLSLASMGFQRLVIYLVAGALLIGLLAGSYPAFYLSGLRPARIFHGRDIKGGASALRSALIVLQFAIAVTLILATIVVFRQLDYVRAQDLGFDAENVVVLPEIREIADDFEPFRARLERNPDILDVTQSNPSLMNRLIPPFEGTAYRSDGTQTALIYPAWVDHRYFPTFGIPIVAGRNFDLERASDRDRGLILNETAARRFGWTNPADAVGEEVFYGGTRREVIGIARDFHQESLHEAIIPMGFYQDPRNYRAISVRFKTGDFPALLSFLKDQWAQYYPNRPLDFDFLDQRVSRAYEADEKLGTLFGSFAFLGIFVAGLGLFAISAVTVQRRRKEIGIRKVVGATTPRLVLTIASEFVKLSLVAVAVGGAAGFYLMSRWLENFAYHGSIGIVPVVLAGLITVAAALLAVFYESISAAMANPVQSLKHD